MISTTSANKIIDHFLTGRTSTTMPTGYAGLFTTYPTGPGNAGTEATGGSYARLALGTGGSCIMGAAASGLSSNSAQQTITAPTGTMTGVGVWDASTSGTLIWASKLQQTATSEAVTLASGLGSTANLPISNVVVKNNTDITTYTEGIDYYVSYDGGAIIRISTGSITASQPLHVTYQYPVTKATTNGDAILFAASALAVQLNGFQA